MKKLFFFLFLLCSNSYTLLASQTDLSSLNVEVDKLLDELETKPSHTFQSDPDFVDFSLMGDNDDDERAELIVIEDQYNEENPDNFPYYASNPYATPVSSSLNLLSWRIECKNDLFILYKNIYTEEKTFSLYLSQKTDGTPFSVEEEAYYQLQTGYTKIAENEAKKIREKVINNKHKLATAIILYQQHEENIKAYKRTYLEAVRNYTSFSEQFTALHSELERRETSPPLSPNPFALVELYKLKKKV